MTSGDRPAHGEKSGAVYHPPEITPQAMGTEAWVAIAIVVILILAYGAYKYQPAWFSSILGPVWVPVRAPHSPTSCGDNITMPAGTAIHSMADCQAACVSVPTCQGIFRDEHNNSCWLKNKGWCADSSVQSPPPTNGGLWAYTPRAGGAPTPAAA